MKVFISWSGTGSQMVAEALRDWLPNVIQALNPWMSANDVEKGARWRTDIAVELEQSSIGIICLTPENLNAPWILFEAGALSKLHQNAYICTYLYGLEPSDLKDPLAQFQTTKAERDDTRRLLHTINRALMERSLPESKVDDAFDVWWPKLEERLGAIILGVHAAKPKRSERELIEEVLELVREQSRQRVLDPSAYEPRGARVARRVSYANDGSKVIDSMEPPLADRRPAALYYGLGRSYPKIYATVIERTDDDFIAESSEGIRFRVNIHNRSGKGSRTKIQPGVAVKLYQRPEEEFFRYRFIGG
jgi:TIR domain-containing protein